MEFPAKKDYICQATITVGFLVSPFLQARFDCKDISAVFLLVTSLSMLMMGLSFTCPDLSMMTIPSLVVAGLAYGLRYIQTLLSLVELLHYCSLIGRGLVRRQQITFSIVDK